MELNLERSSRGISVNAMVDIHAEIIAELRRMGIGGVHYLESQRLLLSPRPWQAAVYDAAKKLHYGGLYASPVAAAKAVNRIGIQCGRGELNSPAAISELSSLWARLSDTNHFAERKPPVIPVSEIAAAPHPGTVLLKQFLEPRKMSVKALAGMAGCNSRQIRRFILGDQMLTTNLAIRFAKIFGTSETFWKDAQFRYEITVLRLKGRL